MVKVDLGRRIHFFRKRAKISQLELEIKIEASSGMISRIESNTVNPTKETVINISKALNLSSFELDYLIGTTAFPASEREIENAKVEASDELNKRGNLTYLLDERWRFHQFSDIFSRFLNFSKDELDYIIGKTTVQLVVKKDSPMLERFDKEHFPDLLHDYLAFYYSTMSFMEDDPIYQESLQDIMQNAEARKIWKNFTYEKDRKYTPLEKRVIHFDLQGKKIALYYSALPLPLNSRFLIVEYYTENKVSSLLEEII